MPVLSKNAYTWRRSFGIPVAISLDSHGTLWKKGLYNRMHDDPNKDPSETWREHLKRAHAYLKKSNPGSTLMDAVRHSRDVWRERKSRLYDARQGVIGELRKRKDRGKRKSIVKQEADNAKAERVEKIMAADILTLFKNDVDHRLKF